jgi:hypothetical protein
MTADFVHLDETSVLPEGLTTLAVLKDGNGGAAAEMATVGVLKVGNGCGEPRQ